MTKPEDNIVSAHFKIWSVLCTLVSFSLQNIFALVLTAYDSQFAEIVSDTRTPDHRRQLDVCESLLSDAV